MITTRGTKSFTELLFHSPVGNIWMGLCFSLKYVQFRTHTVQQIIQQDFEEQKIHIISIFYNDKGINMSDLNILMTSLTNLLCYKIEYVHYLL